MGEQLVIQLFEAVCSGHSVRQLSHLLIQAPNGKTPYIIHPFIEAATSLFSATDFWHSSNHHRQVPLYSVNRTCSLEDHIYTWVVCMMVS